MNHAERVRYLELTLYFLSQSDSSCGNTIMGLTFKVLEATNLANRRNGEFSLRKSEFVAKRF